MGNVINPALLGNWENWVRIFLMVALGAIAFHFANRLYQQKKGA